MGKTYYTAVIRVVKNTGPVGGSHRCEVGCWVPDTLRGKRDRFRVERTIKVGAEAECLAAKTEAAR